MLWQNASARTGATATPLSSRDQARSSRVRIVVAPSRVLAEGREVVLAEERRARPRSSARSSARGQAEHVVAAQWVDDRRRSAIR